MRNPALPTHSGSAACRCPSTLHTCGLPNPEEHYIKWAAETETQLEVALGALRDPGGTIDDVFSAITLGELAYRIALGERNESDWPDEYEPECICPSELVARGGFKGGCPVHA